MQENYVEYLLDRPYRKMHLLTGEYKNVNTKNVIGKCHNQTHPGIITKSLLEEHECLNKTCPFLEKFSDHPFWVEYERKLKKKNERKEIKKNKQEQKNDIMKKCNNLKIQIEYVAKKYDYNIKILDVKLISRNYYKVFYVSDRSKNDWQRFSSIISVFRDIYDYRLSFTHVKDVDGHYVTIDELDKKKN